MYKSIYLIFTLIILIEAGGQKCNETQFECLNDRCIDHNAVNDGVNDCGDNSDEDHLYDCYNYHNQNYSFQSNEHALYKCLTSNYSKYVRPVHRENDPVQVEFGLNLIKVVDLHERDETLTIMGWLYISWEDMFMKWNKEDFKLVDINLPVDHLWTPDILLYNSAQPWSYGPDVQAVVYNNGKVLWIPHVTMKSFCKLDLTKFPYDTQTCHLKFGSWTYPDHRVNLTLHKHLPIIQADHFTPHAEYEVTSTSGQRNEVKYEGQEEIYVDVTYKITLRRHNSHYVNMLVAPAVTLLLLLPAMFMLPAGCGEKTHLGTGILLSLVLLLVVIIEFVPVAHPNLPYLGQFYLASMVLVALSLLCSTIVTSCWMRANRRGNVPKLLRLVFLGFISSLLCIRRDDHVPDEDDSSNLRKLEDNLDIDPAEDRSRLVRNYARTMAIAEWRQLATVLDRIFMILFFIIAIIIAIAYLK